MTLVQLDCYYREHQQSALPEHDITNFQIVAQGNKKVGLVTNMLVDKNSGQIRYLIVDTGFWVLGKKVLLPIALCLIASMDRQVYVEQLTKEQVKALPQYDSSITVNPEYEECVRSVLRPLIAEASVNQVDNFATYDLAQEPYFYEIKDQQLQAVQEQLTARRSK